MDHVYNKAVQECSTNLSEDDTKDHGHGVMLHTNTMFVQCSYITIIIHHINTIHSPHLTTLTNYTHHPHYTHTLTTLNTLTTLTNYTH